PYKARRYEIYVIRVLDRPTPSTRREKAGPPPVSKPRVGNGDRWMANELGKRLGSNRNAGKILTNKEDEDDGT
ncbi:CaiF/GrlA family transcriptional regulator, partial [Salmonella enterica]|uniref:CaiF/GrlA family transcriptional regulator n=1 Tax=Salmonella enterica TaxID=28901 RepID=UPI003296F9F0